MLKRCKEAAAAASTPAERTEALACAGAAAGSLDRWATSERFFNEALEALKKGQSQRSPVLGSAQKDIEREAFYYMVIAKMKGQQGAHDATVTGCQTALGLLGSEGFVDLRVSIFVTRATALLQLGERLKAAMDFQSAAVWAKARANSEPKELATWLRRAGANFVLAGAPKKAEPLLRQSIVYYQREKPLDPSIQESMMYLAKALKALGQHEEAAKWEAKLQAMR